MRKYTRKPNFIAGILALLIALVQLNLCVYQPVSMKGYTATGVAEGYQVTAVVPGSPAEKAGFQIGDVIVSMNDIDMGEYRESFVVGKSDDIIYAHTPYLYARGETYRCTLQDGTIKTYTIPAKAPFFQVLGFMSWDNVINFITGGLFIILGLLITVLSPASAGISDFIWFMYATGICIINSYVKMFNTLSYSMLTVVLYNLSCAGIAFSLLRIIGYFYRILKKEKGVACLRIVSYVPLGVISIILILMLSGAISFWKPFNSNSANLFGSIVLVSALLYSLFIFIGLLRHIPRQSSLTLRFFLMGICFGALPALFVVLLRTITSSFLASSNESLVTILPLLSIPVAVFCSVFQSIKPEYDQIASRIMTGVGTVVILILVYVGLPEGYAAAVSLMCMSPFIFLLMEKPVTAFLYPKLSYVQDDLDQLEKQVFCCDTEDAVYDTLSQWLFTNLNATFVVFSKLSGSEGNTEFELLYETTRETVCDMTFLGSMFEDRLRNESRWKGLLTHPGRGCSCPLYQSHEITGFIFVGARSENDMFSGMEMRVLPPLARILMEALIMLRLRKQGQYLSDMQNQIVFSFADMIESRDGSTGLHVKRTSQVVELIAKQLRLKDTYGDKIEPFEFDVIALAAPLHDIGKIQIPDAILSKPGKLTEEEFAIIKTHPVEGEKIIRKTMSKIEDEKYLEIARDMALYHHEKWNGTGYPEGLKEDEIPVCARIMAVADVFDALCSARCYKKAFTIEEAYAIFEESRGTHFEPVLVDILQELRPELEKIYQN